MMATTLMAMMLVAMITMIEVYIVPPAGEWRTSPSTQPTEGERRDDPEDEVDFD